MDKGNASVNTVGFAAQGFMSQLAREFLRRLAWGSMVGATFVFLLIYSSAWRSAAAAFAHADFAAAAWIDGLIAGSGSIAPSSSVVTLAIGDQAYAKRFGAASPLNRQQLLALANEALAATTATGAVLVVDLDVSPSPPAESRGSTELDALDQLWIAHKTRVVLALPAMGASVVTDSWVKQMCAQGVAFGRADTVEVYGLLDLGRDINGSLAEAAQAMLIRRGTVGRQGQSPEAAGGPDPTARCDFSQNRNPTLNRHATSAAALALPVRVPVLGRDQALAPILSALAPAVVLLGGTWGQGDSFRTPFGPRFGVDVHAAKITGRLQGRWTLPNFVQVLLAVAVAAVAVTVATWVARALAGASASSAIRNGGQHDSNATRFFRGTGSRFVVLVAAIGTLTAIFLVSALAHAFLGVWAPTLILIGFSAVSLTADWQSRITKDLQADVGKPISRPLWDDFGAQVLSHLSSARESGRLLFQRSACSRQHAAGGRCTALYEFVGSCLALLGRTVVPALALAYLLLR